MQQLPPKVSAFGSLKVIFGFSNKLPKKSYFDAKILKANSHTRQSKSWPTRNSKLKIKVCNITFFFSTMYQFGLTINPKVNS